AAVAADQCADASRYVTPVDVSSRFAPFAPATVMASRAATPDGRSWSYLELTHDILAEQQLEPLRALEFRGFERADPAVTDGPEDLRWPAWKRLAPPPSRYRALMGVSGVFMTPKDARVFATAEQGSVIGLFDVDRATGRFTTAADLRRAPVALLEPSERHPSPAVYHDWTEVGPDPDEAFIAFARPDFDPALSMAVAAPASGLPEKIPGAPPEPAKWKESPCGSPRANRAVVETSAGAPGMLLLRDFWLRKFWPDLVTKYDGKPGPAPLLADGMFLAVPVPAGKVVVTVEPAFPVRKLLLPLAGAVAFAALFALWCAEGGRKERTS
ncbi:MAG: hypothetical protein IJ678_06220, partial [Kiritimatiellae bacterium]|nr:hypothetical protein [Kiritimatiellia bacterium]